MRTRIGLAVLVAFAGALALPAQQKMFKVQLNPTGTMISLDQPVLMNGHYVFHAWPDGEQTALRQVSVLRIVPLTGREQSTVYRVALSPSGSLLARDMPVLRTDGVYVFHAWRGAELMSLREADVRQITKLTGDDAFWAIERANGETSIGGTLAMQGTSKVVSIGVPPGTNTAQAGRTSMSAVNNSGISGANPYGNWSYQGTPGVSDAWSPANATMQGGAPTMPGATNGMNAPTLQPPQ
jgi:hypothetical protein